MKKSIRLRITEPQLTEIKGYLYPGDSKESVAIVVCGVAESKGEIIFLVHEIVPFNLEEIKSRSKSHITWKTALLAEKLSEYIDGSYGILKIHSHPSGIETFSNADDISDKSLANTVHSWLGRENSFMSAILLPDGVIKARVFNQEKFEDVDDVLMVGDRISPKIKNIGELAEHEKRSHQVFGSETLSKLKKLRVGVIGCSGTGSLVIQQLLHYGVQSLTLIDPDIVEAKNLNRIVGATTGDVKNKSSKVDVFVRYANELGLGTTVNVMQESIASRAAVDFLKGCDVLFSCVDDVYARQVINRMGTYYLIPIIDVGVKILIDGNGGVEHVSARADYILPGESLHKRGIFNSSQLAAASMKASNREEYRKQLDEGYLPGLPEEVPAVITPNSFAASFGILELLNRLHGLRFGLDTEIVSLRMSLLDSYIEPIKSRGIDTSLVKKIGLGDQKVVLGYPSL